MTANCWPRFHVQSMIWATDAVGMSLLLYPPANSSAADRFGAAGDPVGLAGCYDGWDAAVHAEIGSTALITSQGYEVDVMMAAFHGWGGGGGDYAASCNNTSNGDVLWNGRYFGTNVHPYETVFMKANRNIDPVLMERLTEWHEARGLTSWDTCGTS